MRYILAAAALLVAAGPACADPLVLKPLVDIRARDENVDQDGMARQADALTTRVRGGLQAGFSHWSAIVEGQGTLAAVDHYYDGLNGLPTRPLVADPENIALYRAQLQYSAPRLTLTAGRQRIALDDERFVGAIQFRDNAQTFDALRAEVKAAARLRGDFSYIWSVRSIWGIDGRGARQQAISGDTMLANISYAAPAGTLTGFAYLIDEDEVVSSGYRLSSQTYGARFAGARPVSKSVKLSYQLGYARQLDYHRNPNDYHASYYLADTTLDIGALKLGGGYEVLGAAGGTALTSFQTPLATAFKFQGWADKFLTTPANGIHDRYGSAGYGWKKIGLVDALSVQAIYHDFRSDRLDQHYGTEWDLLATAKIGRTTLSARYADYVAKTFATNTRKF